MPGRPDNPAGNGAEGIDYSKLHRAHIATYGSCPHCGSNSGYKIKYTFIGHGSLQFDFSGWPKGTEWLFDKLEHKTGTRAYCIECGNFLYNINK